MYLVRLLPSELYPLTISLSLNSVLSSPLSPRLYPSVSPFPRLSPYHLVYQTTRHMVDTRRDDPLGVDVLALTTPMPALATGMLTLVVVHLPIAVGASLRSQVPRPPSGEARAN